MRAPFYAPRARPGPATPLCSPPPPPPRSKYFAPWCGHCKRLAPTWEELGELPLATADGKKVVVARVDCTVAKDTCTQQGIKGYPTLMVHKAGSKEGERYNGARELDALKAHAEAQ